MIMTVTSLQYHCLNSSSCTKFIWQKRVYASIYFVPDCGAALSISSLWQFRWAAAAEKRNVLRLYAYAAPPTDPVSRSRDRACPLVQSINKITTVTGAQYYAIICADDGFLRRATLAAAAAVDRLLSLMVEPKNFGVFPASTRQTSGAFPCGVIGVSRYLRTWSTLPCRSAGVWQRKPSEPSSGFSSKVLQWFLPSCYKLVPWGWFFLGDFKGEASKTLRGRLTHKFFYWSRSSRSPTSRSPLGPTSRSPARPPRMPSGVCLSLT